MEWVNFGMTFALPRDSYDRYMGRYSERLAPALLDFAEVGPGMRALDVGCGPGALTAVLAERLGPSSVAAADPSEPLLSACRDRVPGADARVASAAGLPWPDDSFHAVLSQLVLNFLPDADAALTEMLRVTRPGGLVAACTWDYAGGMTMLRMFWDAAQATDPTAPDEGRMAYCSEGELIDLWTRTGLTGIETGELVVTAGYADFADFWIPFTLGVGPAGSYCVGLDPERRAALRDACFVALGSPAGTFTLAARAVAVRGRRGA